MSRPRISIIGSGHVGATMAHLLAARGLGDIVLMDKPSIDGLPQGKALDIWQSTPLWGMDCQVVGTTTYEATANSDLVIVAAGVARRPGMRREDLITINTAIVREVAENVAETSPNAVMIVLSNPIDAMVYVAWHCSGFPPARVLGQTGVLNSARFRLLLAGEIGCSVEDVQVLLLGGHDEQLVPLPRHAHAGGIPVTQLVSPARLEEIIQQVRKGGDEILKLVKTGSAYYTPAAATVELAEAVLHDRRRLLPCAAWCDKEYDVGGYYVGVPAILGAGGVQRILEIELDPAERAAFDAYVAHVKHLVNVARG